MKEWTLDIDNKQQPKVYEGLNGDRLMIYRLIMLEPGTYPTHPELGVGLVSKYRYRNEDEIKTTLASNIEAQIRTYMPHVANPQINVAVVKSNGAGTIYINVSLSDALSYQYVIDAESRTLQSIM